MQHRVRRKLCPSERSSGILRIETDQRELPVCRDDPQGRGPTMSPRVGRRSWSVPCNPEPIPTRRRRRQTPRVGGTRPPQYGHPDQEFHQLGVMEAWSQPPLGRLTGVRDRQPCISDAAGAQGRNRASAAAAQVIPICRLRCIHPACQQLIRGTRRSPTYPYERTTAHRHSPVVPTLPVAE